MNLLGILWAGLVWGGCGVVYSVCLLEIYEGKRPHQAPLSDKENKTMQQTITRISLATGAIIAAFAMFVKAVSH